MGTTPVQALKSPDDLHRHETPSALGIAQPGKIVIHRSNLSRTLEAEHELSTPPRQQLGLNGALPTASFCQSRPMAIHNWWDADPDETYWLEIRQEPVGLGDYLRAPKAAGDGNPSLSCELSSYVQPGGRVFLTTPVHISPQISSSWTESAQHATRRGW